MRKNAVVLIGLFVVVAAGFLIWNAVGVKGDSSEDCESSSRLIRDVGGKRKARGAIADRSSDRRAGKSSRKGTKRTKGMRDATILNMSAADQKLYDAVQDAWDSEDFDQTVKCALAAYKSDNPDVREHAIDALGWFGEKALPELTPMMADANEDVASSAQSAWESALSEVESAAERVGIAQLALQTISNADALQMIGSQFANAASDLIDGEENEEKANGYRRDVVQGIVDIMGDKSNAARTEAAKEIYESVTCHEWVSIEEAEKYLANPENYEPPAVQ